MDDLREMLFVLIGEVQDEGRDYSECFCRGDSPGSVSNYVLADHLIANGVTVQEWIPASEPPTEYRDEYGELIPFLVCESGTEYPFRAMYDGKVWGDGLSAIPVTHWMPLPEPPKGE